MNDVIKLFISIGILFITTYLSYLFGLKKSLKLKKIEYIEKQLEQFYSPMMECLSKIESFREINIDLNRIKYKNTKSLKNGIKYKNNQFLTEVLPLYKKMLEVFTNKMWLAESLTKKYYSDLNKFIVGWDIHNDSEIPVEIDIKTEYSEEKLKPFYTNLEEVFLKLQKKLK